MKSAIFFHRRRLAVRCLLALVAIALLLPGSIFAGPYCAIAYSPSAHLGGESHNCNSRAQAERQALARCPEPDAFIAGWGFNRYIALAVGDDGAWGFGSGQNKHEAGRDALNHCPADKAHVARVVWSFN